MISGGRVCSRPLIMCSGVQATCACIMCPPTPAAMSPPPEPRSRDEHAANLSMASCFMPTSCAFGPDWGRVLSFLRRCSDVKRRLPCWWEILIFRRLPFSEIRESQLGYKHTTVQQLGACGVRSRFALHVTAVSRLMPLEVCREQWSKK